MAKGFAKKEEKRKTGFPSDYGSHASMVDKEETEKLGDDNKVVLRDKSGTYVTERKRLDSGLADPNRYSGRVINVQDSGSE